MAWILIQEKSNHRSQSWAFFLQWAEEKKKKKTAPQAPAGGRDGIGRKGKDLGGKKEGLDDSSAHTVGPKQMTACECRRRHEDSKKR